MSRITVMQDPRGPLLLSMLDRAESQASHFHPAPPIACICGSTRFMSMMTSLTVELTLRGWIVLAPAVVTSGGEINPVAKDRLDRLHLRKIDAADVVIVVNQNSYIGESTRHEIDYARSRGKPLWFTDPRMPTHDERAAAIFAEVRAEQNRGRAKYGDGPDDFDHDDVHSDAEWIAFAREKIHAAEDATSKDRRLLLIKAAGLLLSAVETNDRIADWNHDPRAATPAPDEWIAVMRQAAIDHATQTEGADHAGPPAIG